MSAPWSFPQRPNGIFTADRPLQKAHTRKWRDLDADRLVDRSAADPAPHGAAQ